MKTKLDSLISMYKKESSILSFTLKQDICLNLRSFMLGNISKNSPTYTGGHSCCILDS